MGKLTGMTDTDAVPRRLPESTRVEALSDGVFAVPRRLPESTRVEAFSDGVFAIALTLLVPDLPAQAGHPGGFAAFAALPMFFIGALFFAPASTRPGS